MTDRELDDCRRLGINPAHVERCSSCGTTESTCDFDMNSWAKCELTSTRWKAGELERARETLRKHGATL